MSDVKIKMRHPERIGTSGHKADKDGIVFADPSEVEQLLAHGFEVINTIDVAAKSEAPKPAKPAAAAKAEDAAK